MALKLGLFVVPDATDPAGTLAQIRAADESGLDVVAVQDHPYQRRFLDTWTLLSYAAAITSRVTLAPDVANLPLRPPAMLAKAAASLDVLSGGRVELGLGAGGFWDPIVAMGGPRRTPKESVDALVEAVTLMRAFWDTEAAITQRGEHYSARGLRPGPAPSHRIGIWLGAYRPRMLRITGRLADGWLPSLGPRYLQPEDVERLVNVPVLEGPPAGWPDRIARITELGFSTLLVGAPPEDPTSFARRLGEEVAPAARALLG